MGAAIESFSAQLRAEAEPIWARIFAHPFLQELRQGTLPLEKFRYYLAQDYLYLEGFARTVALALAKAPDSRTLEELSRRVLTPVERPLHRKLLAAAGLSLPDIQQVERAPTNTAYVNHMLATASLYGLGPTAAALLPCPWSYHQLKDALGPSEHPLYSQWTAFYVAGFLQDSVEAWRGLVDGAARQASLQEQGAMRLAFLTSSRYEYLFWEMAYHQEQWPI